MYNYGLVSFMEAKSLDPRQVLDGFLQEQGISSFNSRNHGKVSQYVNENWDKFASFVDRGLKAGTLKGNDVRLNYHFEEERKRKEIVKDEWESADLSCCERIIFKHIRKNGVGKLHSLLHKNGLQPVKKDMSYTSKTLQFLPLLQQIQSNNLMATLLEQITPNG